MKTDRTCLRNLCGSSLRRIAEIAVTVVFHCEMTNKYCGDLRRLRVRAETALRNIKILAREIPYGQSPYLDSGFQRV